MILLLLLMIILLILLLLVLDLIDIGAVRSYKDILTGSCILNIPYTLIIALLLLIVNFADIHCPKDRLRHMMTTAAHVSHIVLISISHLRASLFSLLLLALLYHLLMTWVICSSGDSLLWISCRNSDINILRMMLLLLVRGLHLLLLM